MRVLGIETSCDETAAAVVEDGVKVLSSIVASQIDLHGPYGGVVPEAACRAHVEALPGVINAAVEAAGCGWRGIDALAATYGPGLASSLLTGLSAAKALALALGRPLSAVNHMEAHIHSVFLDRPPGLLAASCPFVALLVSGGHSCLIRVETPGQLRLLGQTVDDAAGEAFDKAANLLGLGYPGGPLIDRRSSGGDCNAVVFPKGRLLRAAGETVHGMDPRCCFSFSGLKTALMYYLRKNPPDQLTEQCMADICASYQEAVTGALLDRLEYAVESENVATVALCGGVSLNRRLRERMVHWSAARGVRLLSAENAYCADNAAMIAGLAGTGTGICGHTALAIDIEPNLPAAAI